MTRRAVRRLAIPSLLTVAGCTVLIGLGTWQLERKAWKEGLIRQLDERVSAPAGPLPDPADWASLVQARSEFERVRARIAFSAQHEPAVVYISGSALRDDIKSHGYFVFQPATLPDGRQVVVNRGFSPERNVPAATGHFDIVGYLRWPQEPNLFVSDYDPAAGIWFVADHRAMAKTLQWGDVAPFYIAQESPLPPGGLPRPGPLTVRLRNDHFGYALTWFGLAGALIAVFAVWVANQRRHGAKSASL